MTTDTRNGQSDYEILTRIGIPLVLGDRTWRVKPRVMSQDHEWLASVQARIVALAGAFESVDSIPDIISSLGEATPDMLALIFEYDLTGQLDHEWIMANVYTREITTAFTTLCEEAYPPFAVSRRLVPADRAAAIIGKLITWAIDAVLLKSLSPAPTNSPSMNGASEPPTSLTTA
jgi:hypothetical protein